MKQEKPDITQHNLRHSLLAAADHFFGVCERHFRYEFSYDSKRDYQVYILGKDGDPERCVASYPLVSVTRRFYRSYSAGAKSSYYWTTNNPPSSDLPVAPRKNTKMGYIVLDKDGHVFGLSKGFHNVIPFQDLWLDEQGDQGLWISDLTIGHYLCSSVRNYLFTHVPGTGKKRSKEDAEDWFYYTECVPPEAVEIRLDNPVYRIKSPVELPTENELRGWVERKVKAGKYTKM